MTQLPQNKSEMSKKLLEFLDILEERLGKSPPVELNFIIGDEEFPEGLMDTKNYAYMFVEQGEMMRGSNLSLFEERRDDLTVTYRARDLVRDHRGWAWSDALGGIRDRPEDDQYIYISLAKKGQGQKSIEAYRNEVLGKGNPYEPIFLN